MMRFHNLWYNRLSLVYM